MVKASGRNSSKPKKNKSGEKKVRKSQVSNIQLIAPISKRKILLSTGSLGDTLTIVSPDKKMELQVEWGVNGAVVKIAVAQIELVAERSIGLKCSKFQVHASEGIEIKSEGGLMIQTDEIRARTEKSIHLEGEKIRLNSPEGEDHPLPQIPFQSCKPQEENS